MKITIEDIPEGSEPEIILRCNEPDDALLRLIYSIKSSSKKLIGLTGMQMHVISPGDVFYFEAVDNKVFIYCREKVYESRLKLYELEADYEQGDFFGHPSQPFLILPKSNRSARSCTGNLRRCCRMAKRCTFLGNMCLYSRKN